MSFAVRDLDWLELAGHHEVGSAITPAEAQARLVAAGRDFEEPDSSRDAIWLEVGRAFPADEEDPSP